MTTPQEALRLAREALDEMISVAVTDSDDAFAEWTADNRAQIDKWQCALSDALSAAANPQQATISIRGFAYTVPQPVKHEYEKVRDRMEALELAACAAIPAPKADQPYDESAPPIYEQLAAIGKEMAHDEVLQATADQAQQLSDDYIWSEAKFRGRYVCGTDSDEYIEVRRGDMVAMVREFLGDTTGKDGND